MPEAIPLSEIPSVIEVAYRTRIVKPLFIGAPGIGKTAMVARSAALLARAEGRVLLALKPEACEEARMVGVECVSPRGMEELLRLYEEVRREPDRYFIYLRVVASQTTPEDLQYPRLHQGSVVNVPPVMLAFLTVDGVKGLLFIDEITNVQREDALTMFFALVNEGVVGLAGQLSRDVVVVAAANPPEVSTVAEELPAPLVNRFAVFNVEPPTAEEVASYILAKHGENAHEAVLAYLVETGRVYEPPRDRATLEPFPTPRSWERAAVAAKMLERMGKQHLTPAFMTAILGPRVGPEVAARIKVAPPRLEKLLEDPSIYKRLTPEQKLMVALTLAARLSTEKSLDKKMAKRIARLAETIIETDAEVFMIMKAVARNSALARNNLLRVIQAMGDAKRLAEIADLLRTETVDVKL